MLIIIAVLFFAYLLGSIPTALLISRHIKHLDIRTVGDGNMGAHNTFHEIGPKFGVLTAIIDFAKGALPVFLALILGLGLGWQILTGILAILGHDFPVFAKFKGGQGTATSLGTMMVLFPLATTIGLIIFAITFMLIKNVNVGLGIGGASIALTLAISQEWLLFLCSVLVFLFIPIKLFIDSPRREAIRVAHRSRN